MREPFFSDVEWRKIFNEELNPPFVPLLQSVVSEKFKGNVLYLYRVTCNRIISLELNTPMYMGHRWDTDWGNRNSGKHSRIEKSNIPLKRKWQKQIKGLYN